MTGRSDTCADTYKKDAATRFNGIISRAHKPSVFTTRVGLLRLRSGYLVPCTVSSAWGIAAAVIWPAAEKVGWHRIARSRDWRGANAVNHAGDIAARRAPRTAVWPNLDRFRGQS
ncbi:unnamed protein product, partial [Iphiclides podalirius]